MVSCGVPKGEEQFSADPGHVGGFGVLVDGVGRGLARAVACGKEFTLVATYPYEGPVMDVRRAAFCTTTPLTLRVPRSS